MTSFKIGYHKRKEKEFSVEAVGKTRVAWILEERLERYFDVDSFHEGGWENEGSFFYVAFSEGEFDKAYKRILDVRRKEGWKIDEACGHGFADLSKFVYGERFHIKYLLTKTGGCVIVGR